MIRKVIAGTLIVLVVSSSGIMVYADPIDNLTIDAQIEAEIHKKEIELISPKINPSGEVLPSKNLLISLKVLTEDSVYLSVYKVLEDEDEEILGSEPVKPGENLKIYSIEIKDVKPGDYRIEFAKQGQDEPFETFKFKLKEPSLPNLLEKKFFDLLLGQ